MKTRNLIFAIFASVSLALSSTAVASADQIDSGQEQGDQIVYGGTTQSTDPSRSDYVALQGEPSIGTRSAWGHQAIGGFTFGFKGLSIQVPSGTLAHDIQGSGTRTTEEAAQYLLIASANLCNYRTDSQNRNGNTIYTTWKGTTQYECVWRTSAIRHITSPFTVKKGQQCARLYVGGTFRGEQCHNINQ